MLGDGCASLILSYWYWYRVIGSVSRLYSIHGHRLYPVYHTLGCNMGSPIPHVVYRVHEYCIPHTMVLQISQTQLPILVIMEYLVI